MICLEVPEAVEPEIAAEPMDLDILYEDKDIILINKPKGMVVHPAAGHYTGTLVNGLMYHCKDELSGINGVMRPGIVHRIDMDTTGVLIDPHTGADCSGFVKYVLSHVAGVGLPRTSREQAKTGRSVKSSEMRPGDLIFYTNSKGTVNHVAMYIGNGQIDQLIFSARRAASVDKTS